MEAMSILSLDVVMVKVVAEKASNRVEIVDVPAAEPTSCGCMTETADGLLEETETSLLLVTLRV